MYILMTGRVCVWARPGQVPRAVRGVGGKAPQPPRVPSERDRHVPPREAPVPPPHLALGLPQRLHEEGELYHEDDGDEQRNSILCWSQSHSFT